jgi:hypothetical protein
LIHQKARLLELQQQGKFMRLRHLRLFLLAAVPAPEYVGFRVVRGAAKPQ